MKKLILLVAFTLLPNLASAYIPPYWMILSRTADNHGHGVYEIDQDVVFNHSSEPIILNEKWTVLGEQSLRLDVTGRKQLHDKVHLTYIYQNNRRYFIDENGVKKSEKISNDFTESFFHFRISKNIKPLIISDSIAPAASLRSEPHRYSERNPKAEPESYVRLGRTGGVVAYAIGTPTPPATAQNSPGLWIEQDQFVVRKIRLPSQVEVTADQYKKFSQDLWLPQERQITWQSQNVGQAAKILLNGATALGNTPKAKTNLDNGTLNFGSNPNLSRLLPADPVIREFYNRMR